ncbi:hypothetical protein [Collinsella tanakaei]|uniref:hypothetical protein n=1 Tax=Collinsella tanakaei TaxID=626935 RepID=UPI001F394AC1|nr:hypothetical protein [Collinsella tanakaei]MCF2621210.1 hypothetical protein [Collinsella tanakaei]
MNPKRNRSSDNRSAADASVPIGRKAKGAAQMTAGAALIAVGVPMCILPGPGVAAIAGGAALTSKGQRNFSGREATRIEQRLDAAAARAGAAAKERTARAAQTAAQEAPIVARKVAAATGRGVVAVAKVGGSLAVSGVRALRTRMGR